VTTTDPPAPAGGPTGPATLRTPPAKDVLGVLHTCHTAALEREGIAMFVSLHDARPGRRPVVRDEVALAEGTLLAARFDHYHAALEQAGFPAADDERDETGARELIDVLGVLSDQHLHAPTAFVGPASGPGRLEEAP